MFFQGVSRRLFFEKVIVELCLTAWEGFAELRGKEKAFWVDGLIYATVSMLIHLSIHKYNFIPLVFKFL